MRRTVVILALVAVAACSAEPGSEGWCEAKKKLSKSEWSASDAATYAAHCLIDGLAVGSKAWCESQAEKPKGDWTVDEGTTYAKHCVM